MTICTVAIPVYNRRTLVQRALESALAQDVDGLDILVVDNCSDDGTWEVLQTYHDPRLRLVRNERNVGLFGNFNRCLELAQGSYLRFLCSDDRLVPGCLQREVMLMEQLPSVVLLSGVGRLINTRQHRVGTQADLLQPGLYDGIESIYATLWGQFFYGKNLLNYPSGVLLRLDAARAAGCFDTDLRVVGDLDFFFRVLAQGQLAVVDRVNCEIMVHEQQEGSGAFADGTLVREMMLLTRRFAHLLPAGGAHILNRQLPGWCLWIALKFWRENVSQGFRVHLDLAQYLGGLRAAGIAVCRVAVLRALLHVYGIRLFPLRLVLEKAQVSQRAL